jgi:F0F1-type ATP synthase membrane subunit b/b'
MSEELQSLLDKIKSDGIGKAEAEAKSIVDAAKKEAAEIRAKAEAAAEKSREQSKREAADFAARAEATVRQAMRDVKLQLASDLQAQVADFIAAGVKGALADEGAVSAWISKAVDGYLAQGEKGIAVALGGDAAKMASAVKAALAAKAANGGIAVEASPAFPNGFTIKLDGGRVEQCFTADAISDALGRLLRPELAALMRE